MKIKLTILIISLLTALTGYSQNTNINLSKEQKIEIVKGLQQGEDLKTTVLELQKALREAEAIHKRDSILLVNKDKEIQLFQNLSDTKQNQINLLCRQSDIKQAILKDKNSKRFGFGFSTGIGVVSNGTTIGFQPYIGIGISYNLFKF